MTPDPARAPRRGAAWTALAAVLSGVVIYAMTLSLPWTVGGAVGAAVMWAVLGITRNATIEVVFTEENKDA